jgi:hypothetical protein
MVQLPAVNTPQFDWVLNRLPNRPRPVSPVYQPEVAARQPLEPVDGRGGRDFGAHGSFDDEAVNRSLEAWVTRRPGLAAAAGGLLAALLASRLRRR